MAYVVSRPKGRWEVRESYASPAGPRARTLVSFKILSPDVLERAERRARGAIDRAQLVQSAARAGAPIAPAPGDALAKALLRSVARGAHVRPGLQALIRECLGAVPNHTVDESFADWIGATPEERGSALVDLLELVDHLPKPRRAALRFPGLSPSRLRK